jgi:hypothetical protein
MLPRTMSPRERVGQLLVRAATLVAIVAVAGGIGVALGFALTKAADDEGATQIGADTQARTTATTANRPGRGVTTPTRTAAAAPPPATTTPTSTATTAAPGSGPLADVEVRVLGAILRPAGTPSGRQRRRSRITMRVRAENRGAQAVRIELPILRVGSHRIHPDSNVLTPESQFGSVAPRAAKAVTLRFELVGDATEKATRDRRVRIEIAGRSRPLRIQIGAPVVPERPAATPGAAAAPLG